MGRLRPILLVAGLLSLAAPPTARAIVGGTVAPPGRWPWMVAFIDADAPNAARGQYCGGVVIAPRRVLTAGHCVIGVATRRVRVLVGRTRLTGLGGRQVRVSAIRISPGYQGPGPDSDGAFDAAVVDLAEDAGVPPVALAGPGDAAAWAPGTLAWTMGWGSVNARKSPGGLRYYADRLRELQLPVVGDDACESVYGIGLPELLYRPDMLVCAGWVDGRTGPCFGDSGGPLVVGGPDAWLDVGIVLAGDGCASSRYYELYTRVDRIRAFAFATRSAVQPDLVRRPRVVGPLRAGHTVRCATGRWRGSPAHLRVTWERLGTSSGRAIGRGVRHRLSRRDARHGVRCSVEATNRGGRLTATARPLLPR